MAEPEYPFRGGGGGSCLWNFVEIQKSTRKEGINMLTHFGKWHWTYDLLFNFLKHQGIVYMNYPIYWTALVKP